MKRIDMDIVGTRIPSIEREFHKCVCDEIGLKPREVKVRSHVERVSHGKQNTTSVHIYAIVDNRGNKAESDVRYVTREHGGKHMAQQRLCDDIYDQLSSQEVDLRSITA